MEMYNRAQDFCGGKGVIELSFSKPLSGGTSGCLRQLGATLYYSPISMKPAGALPRWDFSKLKEVKVDGIRENHLRLFIEK